MDPSGVFEAFDDFDGFNVQEDYRLSGGGRALRLLKWQVRCVIGICDYNFQYKTLKWRQSNESVEYNNIRILKLAC